MSMVRCLIRPGDVIWPATKVVPRGMDQQSRNTREALGEFLDASLPRPLYIEGRSFTDSDRDAQVSTALDTMTLTERVFIECEMQTRKAPPHSFDYDPLK